MTPRNQEIYREAFRETANPALIADTDLVITDVNEAACELTGYDRAELVGRTPRCLINDDAVYEEAAEAVTRGESWVGEFESTTSDGRLVYGRGSVSPLESDGEVRGYVAVFTDLTRNRRYQESLRILNRVLRHNLRNDANVVLGHLEQVTDEVAKRIEEPAAADLLASLDTAVERVESMLDQARTTRRFSGVLAGEDCTLRPVDLRGAVEAAVTDVPTERASVHDAVPDGVTVLADDMLAPALHAVVENAVEHNDKSDPRVELSVSTRADRVVLSVADNGPGIDSARTEEIFGYREGDKVRHGEGLSLFFVDRLMGLYGGDVTVRENEPTGTVFDLHFRRPTGDDRRTARASESVGVERPRTRSKGRDANPDSGAGSTAPLRALERGESSGTNADAVGDGRPSRPGAEAGAGPEPRADRWRGSTAGRDADSDSEPDSDSNASPGHDADSADTGPSDPGTAVRGPAAGTDADAGTLAAEAVGASVTAERLTGAARGFPPSLSALPAFGCPHHLLRLRAAEPVVVDGEARFRGAAAAVLTDTAVVVVVDGGETGTSGRLSVPYDSLTAVGRTGDALAVHTAASTYRLLLPRGGLEESGLEDALSFLKRELR